RTEREIIGPCRWHHLYAASSGDGQRCSSLARPLLRSVAHERSRSGGGSVRGGRPLRGGSVRSSMEGTTRDRGAVDGGGRTTGGSPIPDPVDGLPHRRSLVGGGRRGGRNHDRDGRDPGARVQRLR